MRLFPDLPDRLSNVTFLLFLILGLSGCATKAQLTELQNAHSDSQALLRQQAEVLHIQQQRLALLSNQQASLLHELIAVERELEQARPWNAPPNSTQIGDQPAKSSKSAVTEQSAQQDASGKVILGDNEWVWFDLLNRNVKARVDTSVRSSFIYAKNIQAFERDGESWVKFTLAINELGELSAQHEQVYEAPVLRRVKIRQNGSDDIQRRPVVRLKMKVGRLVDNPEFILSDRDDAELPVLLGRTFLRDIAVVDAARTFIQSKHAVDGSQ